MSNGQPFPPLWLAWVGKRTLPLEQIWCKYLRRFGVDHSKPPRYPTVKKRVSRPKKSPKVAT
jgi:hypothetical protein